MLVVQRDQIIKYFTKKTKRMNEFKLVYQCFFLFSLPLIISPTTRFSFILILWKDLNPVTDTILLLELLLLWYFKYFYLSNILCPGHLRVMNNFKIKWYLYFYLSKRSEYLFHFWSVFSARLKTCTESGTKKIQLQCKKALETSRDFWL